MTRRAVRPALRIVGLGKTTVKGNLRNLGGLQVLCRRYDRNRISGRTRSASDGVEANGLVGVTGRTGWSERRPPRWRPGFADLITASRGGGTASRRRSATRRPAPAPQAGAASGTGTRRPTA